MSKLIVANWKSNHNLETALDWVKKVQEFLVQNQAELESQELIVVVAPPMAVLAGVQESVQAAGMKLAVQDLSQLGAGSYTGAVAVQNLAGLGVTYALVGHSERRRHFQETDQVVAQKLQQALQAQIKPILCVDQPYLESQLAEITLLGLDQAQLQQSLVVAYEPISAIGTGQNQPVEQVQAVVKQIKPAYFQTPVLYGGSVDDSNLAQYLKITDGVLVGTASLTADKFIALLKIAIT